MKVDSKLQQNKLILPFVFGVLIWAIIILILIPIYMGGEGDPEYIMTIIIFLLIVIEGSIGVIEIILVYRARVVKMKPKSSYDMGDISDYITLQEQYRSGNYEYETLRSKEDIFRAYEVGKKIVFAAQSSGEKGLFWIGIFLSIFGLILTSILILAFNFEDVSLNIMILVTGNSVCSGIGAVFFVPNFLRYIRLSRSFFIIAPEGVIYRRIWGGIRAYSWKELNLEVYSVTSTISMSGLLKTELGSTTEVHIILPNGSRLKFKPAEYDLSEFVSLKKNRENLRERSKIDKIPRYTIATYLQETEQIALALVVLAFKYYSDPSKDKFETRPSLSTIRKKSMLEAHKKDANKEPIFHYLKKNAGKAFTVQSMYNRIDDIGLKEEAKNNLDMDALEEILADLSMNGKITRQVKDGNIFFLF